MKTTLVCGGLALLALLTCQHNGSVWTSERALWANAVRWAPEHPRPWINLGRAWLMEGDAALAKQAWQEASRVSQLPGRSRYEREYGTAAAETNLAYQDYIFQHYPEVVERLTYVLSVDPHFPHALELRAIARLKLGDCVGAVEDWTLYRASSGVGDKGSLPPC